MSLHGVTSVCQDVEPVVVTGDNATNKQKKKRQTRQQTDYVDYMDMFMQPSSTLVDMPTDDEMPTATAGPIGDMASDDWLDLELAAILDADARERDMLRTLVTEGEALDSGSDGDGGDGDEGIDVDNGHGGNRAAPPSTSSSSSAAPPTHPPKPSPDQLHELMVELAIHPRSPGANPLRLCNSLDNHELGVVHTIWGRTLKATCKIHAKCTLMVNLGWYADNSLAWADVMRWVADAKEASCPEHRSHAQQIVERAPARTARGCKTS